MAEGPAVSGMTTVAAVVYLAILAFKAIAAGVAIRGQAARAPSSTIRLADITVLQPILSGDPALPAMLAENVERLPGVRFAWLIDEADHAAQVIAATLMAAHADRDIVVLRFPEPPPATSPKTFKLHGALDAVTTTCALVLDDDATLSADAVAMLVRALDDADLATALPCYRDGDRGPGRLLAQFVNNNAALTYLPLLPFAEPLSINGMCYAFRTETFRRHDAYGPILGHLADDLALARRMRRLGLRIVQTTACVEIRTSVESWTRYRQQMHRWFLFATLLLRDQAVPVRAAIGVLHGVPPVALIVLFASVLVQPSWPNGAGLVVVLAVRIAVILWFQQRLTGAMRHLPLLSIGSELLQPFHLLHAVADRTIRWRTRVYRVRGNDAFEAE